MYINLYFIPPLLSFIFTLSLAFLVLYQGCRRFANKAFALAMFSVSIMEFGNFMVLNSTYQPEFLFWGRVSLIGCCLIPANWSLFSLVFTRNNYETISKKLKIILVVIYILAFSFLVFIPYDLFITLPDPHISNSTYFLLGNVGRIFSFFLLLSIIFIMFNLEAIYRNSLGTKRWQIKYSILGMFASFTFYIYIISRIILFGFVNLTYLPIGSIVIITCSGLLAYSLIKHRLMNIDIFISRQVFYGSFTIIVISSYLLVVGFIGELVRLLNVHFNLIFYPVFVLVNLVVLSAFCLSEKNREKVKKFIDKHFYSNKFDYRFEWIELTNRISSVINLNDLLIKFMDLIAETMCVSEMFVWLYDDDDKKYHLADSRHSHRSETPITEGSSFIKYLQNRAAPFPIIRNPSKEVSNEEVEFYANNKKFLDTYNVSTISSLIVKDELIGFITLGKEVTGATYNYEDYDILKTMCHQAAYAIMNIKLSERLLLAREMEIMNKIASFVLHDLKNFISMLSLIVQNASHNMDNPEFQKDVLETISKTIGNMKGLMARVSRLPKKMELNKSKTHITELLKDCIKKTRLGKDGIKLTENYTFLPEINIDREKIKSVIQNLILNAQEALKDNGEVLISTFSDNKSLIIEVKDNGPGMSQEFLTNKIFKPFQTTKKKGLGIGLYQCKTIITAHGGKMEVESEEGKGAKFKIYLPLKN